MTFNRFNTLVLEKLLPEASERSFNCDMSSDVKTCEGFVRLIGLEESRKHILCQVGVARKFRHRLMLLS